MSLKDREQSKLAEKRQWKRFLAATIALALYVEAQSISAAEIKDLERQVINEVYTAHRDHYISPTCESIREFGMKADDMSNAELAMLANNVKKAIEVNLLSRELFYAGLIDLAHSGADFGKVANTCWRGLKHNIRITYDDVKSG